MGVEPQIMECKDGTVYRVERWGVPFTIVRVYYADGDIQTRFHGDVPPELEDLRQ